MPSGTRGEQDSSFDQIGGDSGERPSARWRVRAIVCTALVASVTAAVGCSDSATGVPDGRQPPPAPRHSLSDCTMSSDDCFAIDVSIRYLENHVNSTCQWYGNEARSRYNATDRGYKMGTAYTNFDMYVVQQQLSNGYYGFSADGNVYSTGRSELQPMGIEGLGGLLAHEEAHANGFDQPDHSSGVANSVQDMCS